VVGQTGTPGLPPKPGDNQLLVTVYVTAGAQLSSVLVNQNQSTAHVGIENGHPVYTVQVPVPRGSTQDVVFNLTEPGSGVPTIRVQPMVNPMTAKASSVSCH
jgi:hypothetical protein